MLLSCLWRFPFTQVILRSKKVKLAQLDLFSWRWRHFASHLRHFAFRGLLNERQSVQTVDTTKIKLFMVSMISRIKFGSKESFHLFNLFLHFYCCSGFLAAVPRMTTAKIEKLPPVHKFHLLFWQWIHWITPPPLSSFSPITTLSDNMARGSETAGGADFSEEASSVDDSLPLTPSSQSRGSVPLRDYADLNSNSANTWGWQGVK